MSQKEQELQPLQAQLPQPESNTRTKLKAIGNFGFIIFDGDGYYYVTQSDWQALDAMASQPNDAGTLLRVGKSGTNVFVNLDIIGEAPTENT